MKGAYREFTGALILVLLFLLAFGLAAMAVPSWPGPQEPCVTKGNCYCEEPRAGGLKQPANTLSSLTFTVMGLEILWRRGRERATGWRPRRVNPLITDGFYPRLFGAIAICIGLGSMLFHATLTRWGGWIDLEAMFSFLAFVNSYNIERLTHLGKRGFLTLFLLFNALLGFSSAVLQPPIDTYIFIVLGFATICTELIIQLAVRRLRRSVGLLLSAGSSFIFAFWSWLLSRNPELCNPTSALQWHVLWHFVAALDMGLVYYYLRTEEQVDARR